MSENTMMIPENNAIPAHVVNKELAAKVNAASMAGISAGAIARIKLAGKQFVVVSEDGVETPVLAGHMIVAPDQNQYLGCIALGARVAVQKTFYMGKYTPGDEGDTPDCFSEDGVVPDATIKNPISSNCAQCLKNQWGSGVDQKGNATKGKACSDSKILAVYVPKFKKILKMKLPPASLKNYRMFVSELSKKNIPVTHINLMIGFEPSSEFSVLVFRFGGFLPAEALPKLTEMQNSQEVLDIISAPVASIPAPAPVAPAPVAPAPVAPAPVAPAPVAPAPVAPAPVAPAPEVQTMVDLFGGGNSKEEAAAPVEVKAEPGVSDDDLAAAFADMGIEL